MQSLPLPPSIPGLLSDCSKSVTVQNAVPGATVGLTVIRSGVRLEIGKDVAKTTVQTVNLNVGEELTADEIVSAYQVLPDGSHSPDRPANARVQHWHAAFSRPSVDALHECARSFFAGNLSPGTAVELLRDNQLILPPPPHIAGDDGYAWVEVTAGLPGSQARLVVRQTVCNKPPPPDGSIGYSFDSPLRPTTPFTVRPGQTLQAPAPVDGLYACSHWVRVKNVMPGADVFLETNGQTMWQSPGATDDVDGERCIVLPFTFPLVQGHTVTLHQEVAQGCEARPEFISVAVNPQVTLEPPTLLPIPCSTTPSVRIRGLRPEANVEFEVTSKDEVTKENRVTTYLTSATQRDCGNVSDPVNVPAPPMVDKSTVRVRQGECDVWSNWSSPPQEATIYTPSHTKPSIVYKLFDCQDEVVVDGIEPVAGTVYIYCGKSFVPKAMLAAPDAIGERMTVPVNPRLVVDDDVWVEHQVCTDSRQSPSETVKPVEQEIQGRIVVPIVSGENGWPDVTVADVAAGALVTLWIYFANVPDLPTPTAPQKAPYSNSGRSTVVFQWVQVAPPHEIFLTTDYCGQRLVSDRVPVALHPPVLEKLEPSETDLGVPVTLRVLGSCFFTGATVLWDGQERPTTHVTTQELRTVIGAGDVATNRAVNVQVRNVGPTSISPPRTFTIKLPPPAPSPPELTLILKATLPVTAQAINNASWTLLGAGRQLSGSEAPNRDTSTVHIPIPAPAHGSDSYDLSGNVTVSYTDPSTGARIPQQVNQFLSKFTGALVPSYRVEWKGATQTLQFNIGTQPNPVTGAPIFYMVLN